MSVGFTIDPIAALAPFVPDNVPAAEPLPAPATQVVTSWRVSCAGDEAMGLGHPLVWMAISPASGFVECGYCDKRFVIDRAQVQDGH